MLYAAATEEAPVSETLLHDVPVSGGALRADYYLDKFMARLIVRRELRLASFMGRGFRALAWQPSI